MSVKSNKAREETKAMKAFVSHGFGCGDEIAKVAKQLHPKGKVYPLYRSAMVVTENSPEQGTLTIDFYHDPHWMGEDEITKKNLKRFHTGKLIVAGQRSGADIFIPKDDKFTDYVKVPLDFIQAKMIFEKDKDFGWLRIGSKKDQWWKNVNKRWKKGKPHK